MLLKKYRNQWKFLPIRFILQTSSFYSAVNQCSLVSMGFYSAANQNSLVSTVFPAVNQTSFRTNFREALIS